MAPKESTLTLKQFLKLMNTKKTSPKLALALLTLSVCASVTSAAPYTDNFDNTSNITSFGALTTSVSGNILTASRNAGNVDSGFNWQIGGSGNFSLQAPDQQFIFSLTTVAPINGGFYSISALIFDEVGNYLTELTVQPDTNLTGSFDYNIASISSAVSGAEQWFPRVRILPYESVDAGFEFQNFEAVPEPSTYALLGLAGLAGAAFLRFRRR